MQWGGEMLGECGRRVMSSGPRLLSLPPSLVLGYLEEEGWSPTTSQEMVPACSVFSLMFSQRVFKKLILNRVSCCDERVFQPEASLLVAERYPGHMLTELRL